MSLLDDLRKKLDADTFAAVTDQLGDDFNFDVVPRSRLNTVIKQRDTYKAQVEAGSAAGNDDPMGNPPVTPPVTSAGKTREKPVDVEALKSQYEAEKQSAIEALKVEFAGLNMLREAGSVDPDLCWGLIDKTKVTRGADGKLVGLTEQIEAQKTARAYLYGATSARQNAGAGTGRNSAGTNTPPVTKESFMQMSYDEQVAFKAANPEKFAEFLAD